MLLKLKTPTLSVCAALASMLLCASGPAQAAVSLFASCSASIGNYLGTDPDFGGVDRCVTRSNLLLEGTVQDNALETKSLPVGIFSMLAQADYTARGRDGDLGVAVSSKAAIPFTNPYGYTLAQGVTSVLVSATDTLVVTSDTLALGAPVSIAVSGYFEGASSALTLVDNIWTTVATSSYITGRVTLQETFQGTSYFPHRLLDTCRGINDCSTSGDTLGGAFRVDYAESFQVLVGSVLSFSASMQAVSLSSVNAPAAGFSGLAESQAQSMNSLATFMTPLAAGVQLVAASGHNYSVPLPVPVPEPASFVLFGLGLAVLAGRRRFSRPSLHQRDC